MLSRNAFYDFAKTAYAVVATRYARIAHHAVAGSDHHTDGCAPWESNLVPQRDCPVRQHHPAQGCYLAMKVQRHSGGQGELICTPLQGLS